MNTIHIIMSYDEEDELVSVHAATSFDEAEEMSDTIIEATDEIATIRVINVEVGKVFNEATLH